VKNWFQNLPFKCNLQRCNQDDSERAVLEAIADHLQNPSHRDVPFDPKNLRLVNDYDEPGGAVQVQLSLFDPQLESAWLQPSSL
jgi:hypothetical protein